MERLRYFVRVWWTERGTELAFQDVSCRARHSHRDRAIRVICLQRINVSG